MSSNKNKMHPVKFFSLVEHNQLISKNNHNIKVTAPNIVHKEDTKLKNILYPSDYTFKSGDLLDFCLEFKVSNLDNVKAIKEILIEFRFNDNNEDGASFALQSALLKKKKAQHLYETLKDIYLERESIYKNKYLIKINTEENGFDMFDRYGSGVYCVEYSVLLNTRDSYFNTGEIVSIIRNDCVLKFATDNPEIPSIIEPDSKSHKTFIDVQISR